MGFVFFWFIIHVMFSVECTPASLEREHVYLA